MFVKRLLPLLVLASRLANSQNGQNTDPASACPENQRLEGSLCICDDRSIENANFSCTRCIDNYYKTSENTCRQCMLGCQTCNTFQICLKCIPLMYKFHTDGKTCVFVTSPTDPRGPAECNTNQRFINNSCICDQFSVPYQGGCTRCLDSTYKAGQICLTCPVGCSKCLDRNQCTQCSGSNTFNQITGLCSCQPPNILTSSVCRPCPEGTIFSSTYNDCVNPDLTCQSGQTFQNGSCVCNIRSIRVDQICQPCQDGTYKINETSCVDCIEHCINCLNKTICQYCIQGRIYNQTSNKCDVLSGIIVNPDTPICSENQQAVNSSCVCNQSSVMNDQQLCVQCHSAAFKEDNQCFACSANCQSCSSFNQCTQCKDGFELNSETRKCCSLNEIFDAQLKVCSCENGFIPNQGVCMAITPDVVTDQQSCLTGEISLGEYGCVCSQGFRFVRGSCLQCPGRQYYDIQTQLCASCVSNCIQCQQQNSCDRCVSGFVFDVGQKQCVSRKPCGDNEILQAGACVCNDYSIYIDGGCRLCANDRYAEDNECKLDICGNNITSRENEQCDDGNIINYDGCSKTCKIEPGYICFSGQCTHYISFRDIMFTSSGIFQNVMLFGADPPLSRLQVTYSRAQKSEQVQPYSHKIAKNFIRDTHYRIFLDFCGSNLPRKLTTVYYIYENEKGYSTTKIVYDLATKESRVNSTYVPKPAMNALKDKDLIQ